MSVRRLLAALLLAVGAASPAAAADVKVVASGLDSPRHLAFGSAGDLFVAEAGRGGDHPCFASPVGPACVGATGAVTRIDGRGRQSRLIAGLASMAGTPGNTDANGPHGIAVVGRHTVYVTNGGPTQPMDAAGATIPRETLAAQNPVAEAFGRLLRIEDGDGVRPVADIYGFERAVNPDAQVANPAVDSNAVDVLVDGRRFVVADAGGNSIDLVRRDGRVSALTVFADRLVDDPAGGPQVPLQSVPTAVVKGPDGRYYAGELTGVPFPAGAANVYRINPRTGEARVLAGGFTNIMDLAFGRDGTLYVLEIDADGLAGPGTEGAIFALARNGHRRRIALPAGTLTLPGGITVGRRGALFVTNDTTIPGQGQVLRIRP
jgi:hypothetical protein